MSPPCSVASQGTLQGKSSHVANARRRGAHRTPACAATADSADQAEPGMPWRAPRVREGPLAAHWPLAPRLSPAGALAFDGAWRLRRAGALPSAPSRRCSVRSRRSTAAAARSIIDVSFESVQPALVQEYLNRFNLKHAILRPDGKRK
jgi:hypothetical protein